MVDASPASVARDDRLEPYGPDHLPPPPPRLPGEWIGTLPNTPGLVLAGRFTVIAAPSPEHPHGVIAAIGYAKDAKAGRVYVVRVDVATGNELSRLDVGALGGVITSTTGPHASIILEAQQERGLELAWVDIEGHAVRATRMLSGAGLGPENEIRAFEGIDDRIVIATRRIMPAADGKETVTVHLLDSEGRVLWIHPFQGALFSPGDATFARIGDEVVLTNLVGQEDEDTEPVGAFFLHGAPRWREAVLPLGQLSVEEDGRVYQWSLEDLRWRSLNQDLRLGPVEAVPPRGTPRPCWGLTGNGRWDWAVVGEYEVQSMFACCGDFGGGLYICRPPPEGEGDAGTAAR